MNVFLSWSGPRSHGVARAFNEWLPTVVQQLQPWISSESIGKGASWLAEIRDALSASNGVGLFFLTREALSSQWLLFEAGGIAALGHQRVCTVCVDMAAHDLKPPLSFFQSTSLERADIRKLIDELNRHLERPVAQPILNKSFDRAWPDLEEQLAELAKDAPASPPKAESGSGQPLNDQTLASVLEGLRRIESRLGNLEQQAAAQAVRADATPRKFSEMLGRVGTDSGARVVSVTFDEPGGLSAEPAISSLFAPPPPRTMNALEKLVRPQPEAKQAKRNK